MLITHIVGARPNFMKVGPVLTALSGHAFVTQRLVHTGQHYDANMSEVFFRQLGLPEPDVNLEVGSGSHASQTAQTMVRLEALFETERPDLVLVYGDVNSTVAASLVCAKLHIRLGHVEAGLRSWDRTMPEEINRLVTDALADDLFTPSRDGDENLLAAGVSRDKIHFVGNVMIDTLVRLLPQADQAWPAVSGEMGLEAGGYVLVTLHRPSNVDEPGSLGRIVAVLDAVAADEMVVFPVHPRTRAKLSSLGWKPKGSNLVLTDPVGYLEFLALQKNARLVVTDSGGVQEETTYLGIPCLTVRENTERPVTMTHGTNRLVGQDTNLLLREIVASRTAPPAARPVPELWDGHAGDRIASIVVGHRPDLLD